jgi:uncharacterized protein YjiS (DUF1127 family)
MRPALFLFRAPDAVRSQNGRQSIFASTTPVPHDSRWLQAERLHLKLLHCGRQGLIAVVRSIWTIWIRRAALNELDSLTDADFRDMPIKRADVAAIAWESGRRYVDERTVPTRFLTGFAALIMAAAALAAAAISLMA